MEGYIMEEKTIQKIREEIPPIIIYLLLSSLIIIIYIYYSECAGYILFSMLNTTLFLYIKFISGELKKSSEESPHLLYFWIFFLFLWWFFTYAHCT